MRLFVGIPFNSGFQAMIFEKCRSLPAMAGIRLVKPENYHVTIQFLGDSSQSVDTIAEPIRNITDNLDSFSFTMDQMIGFPSIQKANTVALSLQPTEPFVLISSQIRSVLSPLGFKTGKTIIPHITIARSKHAINASEWKHLFQIDSLRQVASEIVLYQSILQPEGPIYHRLISLKLKGDLYG